MVAREPRLVAARLAGGRRYAELRLIAGKPGCYGFGV